MNNSSWWWGITLIRQPIKILYNSITELIMPSLFSISRVFKNVPFPSKTKRTRSNYEIIAVQSPVTPKLPHFFTFFANSQKSFTVYMNFMADGKPDIVCKLEFIDKFNIASSQNLKK